MSSRLLAATLLAVSLAGPALALQVKASDALSDAAHGAVADLAPSLSGPKTDAGMWFTTEAWTIGSAPARRLKSLAVAVAMDDADPAVAAPASKSPSPQTPADESGALSRRSPGSRGTDNLNEAVSGDVGVSEHRPGGKTGKVG